VAGDLEALPTQSLDQFRRDLFDQVRVVGQGQVADLAGLFAAKVIVGLATGVVPGGAGFVGDAGGQAGVHQRFQRLIDCG
jgi:hypothetical protein